NQAECCEGETAETSKAATVVVAAVPDKAVGGADRPQRDRCPGCGSEAAAARCARCGGSVCVGCARRDHCPLCAFDVVREVLAGRRVAEGPGDAKLTHLLLNASASDIRIDAHGIEWRHADAPRPDRGIRGAEPVVVGHLMDRAGLARITEPIVVAIHSAPVWLFDDRARAKDEHAWGWSTQQPPAGTSSKKLTPPDRCAWFIPSPDALQILLRAQPELPPLPQAIPAEGPFAAVPLSPWAPAPSRFRDEDPPLRCPHCQELATHYRDLGERLVCPACGRSFAVGHSDR